MTRGHPTVSVVLPVHNGAPEIKDAVNSVLEQSYPDFELLVVDDGSTDDTAAILAGYSDVRIRVIAHGENQGLVFSLNEAIGIASAQLIARLDHDCRCYPDRLERQVAVLRERPDVGLVTGPRHKFAGSIDLGIAAPPPDHASLWFQLLYGNCMGHSTVMFRRSVFEEVGGYRPEWFPAEDYDLWLRMASRTRFAVVRAPLIFDSVDPDGISGRLAEAQGKSSNGLSRAAIAELIGGEPVPGLLERTTSSAPLPCKQLDEVSNLVFRAARGIRDACRVRGIPVASLRRSITPVLRPSRFRHASGRRCWRGLVRLIGRHPVVALASARQRVRRRA